MAKPSTGKHRREPPHAGPPVAMVAAFLDHLRATMLWKLEGLSEEEATRRIAPSGLSLLGIVKHLAYVERWWFRAVFAGEARDAPSVKADWDASWRIGPGESIAAVVALYEAECARSREIVAGGAWDAPSVSVRRPRSLGWILTHMVEETARHCGHADLLREQIDGATGR